MAENILPFEERKALLQKALDKETSESLLMKLESYSPSVVIPDACFKTWEGYDQRVQRRIVSAANRFYDKATGEMIVIASARHYSTLMGNMILFLRARGIELSKAYGDDQGFIDQFDDYHTREEALLIAQWADQLPYEKCSPEDELFSEDLYR